MENALLIGLSRQVALERQLAVVANNVANLNTTGFKSNNSLFEEYLIPIARENRFGSRDRLVSFVQDRGTWHDLSQGAVQHTGNPLDISIDGDAFLVVQTAAGLRYTRNGALQINSQGQLVTSDGSPVLGDNGPIVFQQLDRNISISANGRVTVNDGPDSRTEAVRGQLQLVRFEEPQQLKKDGANNFFAPEELVPQQALNTRVIQGAIEKSNVKGVVEMTRMIEITHAYTQMTALLQQQNDLRRTTIQQLAEVPN